MPVADSHPGKEDVVDALAQPLPGRCRKGAYAMGHCHWLLVLIVASVTLVSAHELAHMVVARSVGGHVLGLGHVGIWGPGVWLDLSRVSPAGQLAVYLAGAAVELVLATGLGLV
jgi:hypothetical protein